MVELRSLRADTKAMVAGIWREFHGVRLLIARMHHPEFDSYLQAIQREHLDPKMGLIVDGELGRKLLGQAMGHHILKNWEGLTEDGQPIPYSPEKATELLNDPELVEMRDFVFAVANQSTFYRQQQEEAVSGN